ncbi:hypothetical protein JMJ77_0007712, partial [Colletotrichum scovillei]
RPVSKPHTIHPLTHTPRSLEKSSRKQGGALQIRKGSTYIVSVPSTTALESLGLSGGNLNSPQGPSLFTRCEQTIGAFLN